jgi:ribosomal protein S18 acetylase RimI-like enzyme
MLVAVEDEAYSGKRLGELLAFASANARVRPEGVYLMPGDVAWRGPSAEDVWLWWDAVGLAGYACFDAPAGVEFDLRHDLAWDGDVGAAMLGWAEQRRRALPEAYPWLVDLVSMDEWAEAVRNPRQPRTGDGSWLTVTALETDGGRVAALEQRGYRRTGHHAPQYRLDLRGKLPAPRLPAGISVRHLEEPELEERAATHRDAWVGSTFSAERLRELRASPAYDPELDLVVDAGDGTFAACCICWADAASGIGNFEPVGTRPAWRGKGLTTALVHEGLRRLKAKGMHTARVETAGFNAPAQALYEGCGFVRTDTLRTFMRRLD